MSTSHGASKKSAAVPSVRPSVAARLTRVVARATAPLSRPLAGRRFFPLWAVVYHRGRRSGRGYAVPVAIRVTHDILTIPLPWGEETRWARNVIAAAGCTVRWNGRELAAIEPRILGLDEAADAFHPAQRAVLRAGRVRSVLRLRTPDDAAA